MGKLKHTAPERTDLLVILDTDSNDTTLFDIPSAVHKPLMD